MDWRTQGHFKEQLGLRAMYYTLYIEGNPSKLAVSKKRAYDFLGICKAPIRS